MTPTPTHKALTPAGEWVEGWFDYSDQTSPTMWIKTESISFPETVLPSTVCRATGRPDSNGKMMYEGDEITFEDTEITPSQAGTEYDPILNTGYIYWYNDECKFYVSDILSADIAEVWERATLTGKNIHDKINKK